MVLHLASKFLHQDFQYNEMKELQKDARDARALVYLSILFLVGQEVLRHKMTYRHPRTSEEKQDSKIICHDNVRRYCSLGSRTAPR